MSTTRSTVLRAGTPSEQERAAAALKALDAVSDPEIPPLSIIDLGIIASIRFEDDRLIVDMTPTFAGCPALDIIRQEMGEALRGAGESDAVVKVVFDPPWTSDRITEKGRAVLSTLGIAPPEPSCREISPQALELTPCPYCGSKETDVESIFGPTLCRSIHYCRSCLQSFEHFKPV